MSKRMVLAGILAALFFGCQTNSYELGLLKDVANNIAEAEDRSDATVKLYVARVEGTDESASVVAKSLTQRDMPFVGRITIESQDQPPYNGYYVYALMQRRWQTPTMSAYRDYAEAILTFARPTEVYKK